MKKDFDDSEYVSFEEEPKENSNIKSEQGEDDIEEVIPEVIGDERVMGGFRHMAFSGGPFSTFSISFGPGMTGMKATVNGQEIEIKDDDPGNQELLGDGRENDER